MPDYDWKTLLTHWSQAVLSTELECVFPPGVRASAWLGYPPAAETQIAQAEARLQRTLPPSYRAFLQVTNGWRTVVPFLGRFWSTDEIEWLATRRSSLIEDWLMGETLFGPVLPVPDQEYFIYGEAQDSALIRSEYLRTALEISDLDTRDGAIYLLNPRVVTPGGEWEAWYFASWLSGAMRYRSFWEMMQAEYDRLLDALQHEGEYPPEFIAYAAERLRPGQPSTLATRLPSLMETLQEQIERHRAPESPQAGSPPTLPGYGLSVAQGLQVALDRVQEIQAHTDDPGELRGQLGELADELDRLARKEAKTFMQDPDMNQVLWAGMKAKFGGDASSLDELYRFSGRPVGYRTAAEQIRSFLDER